MVPHAAGAAAALSHCTKAAHRLHHVLFILAVQHTRAFVAILQAASQSLRICKRPASCSSQFTAWSLQSWRVLAGRRAPGTAATCCAACTASDRASGSASRGRRGPCRVPATAGSMSGPTCWPARYLTFSCVADVTDTCWDERCHSSDCSSCAATTGVGRHCVGLHQNFHTAHLQEVACFFRCRFFKA